MLHYNEKCLILNMIFQDKNRYLRLSDKIFLPSSFKWLRKICKHSQAVKNFVCQKGSENEVDLDVSSTLAIDMQSDIE